ncbi:MAG: M20/M25/M40 family metallo-hydrolase [Desulfobacteraceae bacterium]|nr:M20/M25/M40 family metallo-hydrolase [Desulfobacteraceae bacterium]
MDMSLLKRLTGAPGVSGFEAPVRKIVRDALKGLSTDFSTDQMGNLTARVPGPGPKLLLDAHMDEVGFLVRHIDKDGFLRLISLGSIDPRVVYGQTMIVHGAKLLRGIVGSVPPHILGGDDEKKKTVPMEELFVDLGLPAEEVRRLVAVGDPAMFDSQWHENAHSIQSKALDDRIGLFIMIEALREAVHEKKDLPCDLYLLASAQEEVGLRGAGPAARRMEPDLVLALEGTVANDLPGVPDHHILSRINKGPEIRLSDARFLADRAWAGFIISLAQDAGLPHQVVVKKAGGTNAAALQVEGQGARAAALSVPVRYIHAPTGITSIPDIAAAISLTARVILNAGRFWNEVSPDKAG